MGSSGLESAVSVCDSASGIVVEVALDIAADDAAEGSHKVVNLSRACASLTLVRTDRPSSLFMTGETYDSICDTDTVYTDLVDSAVEGKKIDQVRSEAVLGGESDFQTLGLDELNDLDGGVLMHVRQIPTFVVLMLFTLMYVISLPWLCSRKN